MEQFTKRSGFRLLLNSTLQTVVLAALLIAGSGLMSPRVEANRKCSGFQYYMFAQYWTPSICIDYDLPPGQCIVPHEAEDWVIHGLWPSSFTVSRIPEFCHGSKFSVHKLHNRMSRLKRAWPNPILQSRDRSTKDRYWLWRHEWNKHGRCAVLCDRSVDDEYDYFAFGLDLHKTYDIGSALMKAGIEPDDEALIPTKTIEQALHADFGAMPELRCVRSGGDKKVNLFAVRLCLTPGSEDLIDCPASDRQTRYVCPDKLIYPTRKE